MEEPEDYEESASAAVGEVGVLAERVWDLNFEPDDLVADLRRTREPGGAARGNCTTSLPTSAKPAIDATRPNASHIEHRLAVAVPYRSLWCLMHSTDLSLFLEPHPSIAAGGSSPRRLPGVSTRPAVRCRLRTRPYLSPCKVRREENLTRVERYFGTPQIWERSIPGLATFLCDRRPHQVFQRRENRQAHYQTRSLWETQEN